MNRYFNATENEKAIEKRYYNERNGWGTIKGEAPSYYIIIFDNEPTTYEQIIKLNKVDDFYSSDKEYSEILKRAIIKEA